MLIKMLRNILLCLSVGVSIATAVSEQVWLQDLNSDIAERHLESGLPSTLSFRLSRRGSTPTDVVDLKLEENTRLNANAPVFDVQKTANGKQKLVRKDTAPLTGSKFYRDTSVGGVFQVTCQNRKGGACQRSLYGHLNISGRNYEIQPVPSGPEFPSLEDTRSVGDDDVPHMLIPSGNSKDLPNLDTSFSDAAEIPDEKRQEELLEELKSFLGNEQRRRIEKKLAMKYSRAKRANPVYALEILIAVDNALWERYYATTSASGGLNKVAATELRLRQHFAHIINGASLRYESIDDPGMNIYLTLSGFIFYKTLNNTNPYPPSTLSVVNGQEHCDADSYINNLIQWSSQLEDLPHNDHIAVFTGYELYTGSVSNTAVAGKAWLKGVCNSYRTSINEDTTYFTTVSVFAHELGHKGNCLLDHGDYYDDQEYTSHVSLLPGELHSPDEQCKLARGDNSNLCSSPTDEDICREMLCKGDDGYCWFYAAARGTPCGATSQNKWCIDGLCVAKSEDHVGTVGSSGTGGNGGSVDTGSNTGSGTGSQGTVTDAPVQTGGNGDCVNVGWQDWTCRDISEYFYDTYSLTPSQWCTDPNWYSSCCAYCTGGDEQVVQTTTTTTEAPASVGGCEDTGWSCASGPWTCQEVSDYFYANYNYTPNQWCLDPNWKTKCCQFCAGYGI